MPGRHDSKKSGRPPLARLTHQRRPALADDAAEIGGAPAMARDPVPCACQHLEPLPLLEALHDGMAPLVEPLLREVHGHLEMALERIARATEAEGLVAAGGAGHELHRALRHIERVLVPLQDALARCEPGQQRILLAFCRDLDLRIAALELLVR